LRSLAIPLGPDRDCRVRRHLSGVTLLHIQERWALEGDLDPATVKSNTFSLEWPPRSGRQQEFPEIDRVAWLPVEEARRKIVPGQVPLLEQLALQLGGS